MVKNPPTNAVDIRNLNSIPWSGRSLEQDMATQSRILTWGIPWTDSFMEDYSPYDHKQSDTTAMTNTNAHNEH